MNMMKPVSSALALAAALASAPAGAADVAGAFSAGRTHFVVSGGTGYAFDQTYFVLGLGAAYYVIDGLNVGLQLESWSGGDPHFYKVTPSVQYVFHRVPVAKPYIGAFYRRTYVQNLQDIDSAGGRAGVYVQAGRNAYLGVGAVYESYLDCNKSIYRSCSETYPELSFTVAF
jgi:hypothetical protein